MTTATLDGWQVRVPAGWEPVAAVCAELFDERDRITELINDRIRAEIAEFREPASVITRSDLAWSTGGGVANFLRGVAELTQPSENDLRFQRLVGCRSATLGLPLEPLIASFQVGFRELWSILARRTAERADGAAALLLERGTLVWERLVASTSAVGEGYKEEQARRQALEATTTAHLVEALDGGADADARALATELGFDPDGTFRVVELSGPITVEETARAVVARLVAAGCVASMARRGRGAVVLVQGEEPLDGYLGETPTGVSALAHGIEQVRGAITEARLAVAIAPTLGRPTWFDRDWLHATVLAHGDAAERLLAPGIALARAKPHLADAVRAYARAGFSIAESSAALRISPSSQRYRLGRWQAQTGWDPATVDGLARSLLAIDLA